MATSSIFASFDIRDKKKSLDFANALVKSEKDAFVRGTNQSGKILRETDDIRFFFSNSEEKRKSK